MPDVTANLLVDLDQDGGFIYDLCAASGDYTSGFWKIENGFSLRGRGRKAELDAAGMASMVIPLDNSDGRFSPKSGTSPYALFSVNRFRPYIGAHVKFTFNGVTYDQIKGIITDIKIGPEAGDQLCEITIRDYMFVLSRTEIRRRVMLDQYTGVIINRLLDDVEGAEDREEVDNPIFAVNTTGWQAVGGGSLSRVSSDGNALEGPAHGLVVASGAASGVRYNLTGLAGDKYQLTAYVKPGASQYVGVGVRVRLADNLGFRADSGYIAMSNMDYWTRVTVSGTFDAGSTSQFLYVEADAVSTFRIGAAHAVPFVANMPRDVDDGQSRLEKYTYHRGAALSAIQEVTSNELGAMFLFKPDGTAWFQDRTHRWRESHSLTSQGTFDERGRVDYQESGDDLVKSVIFDYPHYVDGVAGTIIWEHDRTQVLPVGIPVRVEADYQGGLIRDTITPVANTDYFIVDSVGVDRTGSVTVSFDDFGGGSSTTFTNGYTEPVRLTSYQIRGTPVRLAADRTPARYTPAGGPPLAATLSHDYQLNGSEPAIQAWAEYVGDRYSEWRPRLGLWLSAPFPEAAVATTDMVQILARTISDRVTVVNNNLSFSSKVNGAFYIDSIDLRCTGHSLDATWRLSEADDAYWILGTSQLDTTTVLAA